VAEMVKHKEKLRFLGKARDEHVWLLDMVAKKEPADVAR
jgi:hypothetical protein